MILTKSCSGPFGSLTHHDHPHHDHADHANHADHADHADHANHANHADHADHADNADHADHADHADDSYEDDNIPKLQGFCSLPPLSVDSSYCHTTGSAIHHHLQ